MPTSPSALRREVSTESVRRWRICGVTTSRSTTMEMSCLRRLFSLIGSPQFALLAIDFDPQEALSLGLLKDLAILTLAPAHDRGQDQQASAIGPLHHAVDDLLNRLARQGQPACGAVGLADIGVEDAQVVVDLGDGADRRARVLADRFLLDRDRGRKALDMLDVGACASGPGTGARRS